MELFPAGNHDPWHLIQQVISESDYYLLIIAGKYGSGPKGGVSYTEREYIHARDTGKPIVAFPREGLDALPSSKNEADPQKKKKLLRFRNSVMGSLLVRPWTSTGELQSHVASTIHHLRDSSPRPGWIRAENSIQTESLINRIEQIERDMDRLRGKEVRDFTHRFDNHMAAHGEMQSIIEKSARSNDVTTIRIMGVALKYSWPFMENIINKLFNAHQGRLTIEFALVSPQHLKLHGLPSWASKADGTLAAIERFAAFSPATNKGVVHLTVVQYENLPHWHGMLVNDTALFMGRSNWEFHGPSDPPSLFVGETTYRFFSSDDNLGGADRISLFNNWFKYYMISKKSIVKEYGIRTSE